MNVKYSNYIGSYNDNLANTSNLEFVYSYDQSNRLLSANNEGTIVFDLHNSYDKDGNHKQLKRYNSSGNLADDFSYTYQSGYNRLTKVSGTKVQFLYDSTGNITKDVLNGVSGMIYDHRNLLIEHTKVINDETFITRYDYDEAGNRTRKLILKSVQAEPETPNWDSIFVYPIEGEQGDGNPEWTIFNDEHYVRDIAGNEIANYLNDSLHQWNVFANDNCGYIDSEGKAYFYIKDHLGTVRATVDEERELVNAVDMDMWGHPMDNRTTGDSKYEFTSKERDTETGYDYFGARYYISRVGRWGVVDPMLSKYYSYTPYNYALNNPALLIDPNGMLVDFSEYIKGDVNSESNLKLIILELNAITGLKLSIENGILKYNEESFKKGNLTGSSKARKILLNAINSEKVHNVHYSSDGSFAEYSGGGLNDIFIDPNEIAEFVKNSNKLNDTRTVGYGITFIHELLHNVMGVKDPEKFGERGDVEDVVNDIRDQLNWDQRYSYVARSLNSEGGPYYIPFDLQSKNQIKNGQTPTSKFTYHY